ncbi:S8 family peptidase [Pseudoxanthomonas sp. z9]|uniref:S8 family peptidase n=1 Tax=Pseudoxanthomonas sp. z9 TaxID=2584942 RepID=UPI0015E87F55|nr:S8 family peptidase [Pseudoxanthomonas sp. z9]
MGSIDRFAKAVGRIQGLEWLFELMEDQVAPDEDFSVPDAPMSNLAGRIFLVGSNKEALDQLIALWQRYERDPEAPFDDGYGSFKYVFKHLKTIRYWDVRDRLNTDVLTYWQDEVDSGKDLIRFEIETWYFRSFAKNAATIAQVRELVSALNGIVISEAHINEIAYQGILVELPRNSIEEILRGDLNDLILSDRIMYFRPRPQCVEGGEVEEGEQVVAEVRVQERAPPVLALLDGLPMANHALLRDAITIDDPDDWASNYEAKDRVHGTAMASLIFHGELDAKEAPLTRKIYVRPVLRPDPEDNYHDRRSEAVPNDVLLIDLVHRAVKRICQGEAGSAPLAPSVKIINLSLGDANRIFSRDISPWARLIDWLSHRYNVLFIVSAGNDASSLELLVPRGELVAMHEAQRRGLALGALLQQADRRRLISPAEAMNALTVGALHADASHAVPVADRLDLFNMPGVSPLSRIGHGYKRSIKPDLLAPGGRCLHTEAFGGEPHITKVESVLARRPPGQRVALPPLTGGSDPTGYSRGTSNAAALTSRLAAQIYEELEELRRAIPSAPGPQYDAVLIKALLVHGASWGDLPAMLLALRTDIAEVQDTAARRRKEKDFLARWLGYGALNPERSLASTAKRATILGVGALSAGSAFEFSAPLPPSLARTTEWRRMTATLAWISPTNHAHQGYRRARLWMTDVGNELGVERENSAEHNAARRGTVQHQIFEGERALVYVDGAKFTCKVNCEEDAGSFAEPIRFGLCVSLEVAIDSVIPLYHEIRQRIEPPVQVVAG